MIKNTIPPYRICLLLDSSQAYSFWWSWFIPSVFILSRGLSKIRLLPLCISLSKVVPIPISEGHHSPQLCTWLFEALATALWVTPSRQQLLHPVVQLSNLFSPVYRHGCPERHPQILCTSPGRWCQLLCSCPHMSQPHHRRPSNLSHACKHQLQQLQEIQSSQKFLLLGQKMVYFSHKYIQVKVWLGLLAN